MSEHMGDMIKLIYIYKQYAYIYTYLIYIYYKLSMQTKSGGILQTNLSPENFIELS